MYTTREKKECERRRRKNIRSEGIKNVNDEKKELKLIEKKKGCERKNKR